MTETTATLATALFALAYAGCGGSDIPPVFHGLGFDAGLGARTTDVSPVGRERPMFGSCGGTAVSLRQGRSTVMLVIDRSGSMGSATTDAVMTSRWNALLTSLRNVLPRIDETISLGLVLFPRPGSGSSSSAACGVQPTPQVPVGARNAAAVLQALNNTQPQGATPTNEGVEVGAQYLLATPDRVGDLFLVLATDGGPNCNAALDPATCRCSGADSACRMNTLGALNCLDRERVVATVQRFAQRGVRTFVLGLNGSQDFADVLDAMAVAGGRPRPNAPVGQRYYAVGSADELAQALTGITSALANCRFVLDSSPPDPMLVDLRIDGRSIIRDPSRMDGWDWSDDQNRVIEFFGPTCDFVRSASGGSQLIAAFGCPAPTPP